MVRYASPTQCPDCQATLPAQPTACPRCQLPLVGQTAADLFTTLQAADRLLVLLRAGDESTAPAPAPTPAPTPQRPRPGLSAPSVPRILLGLGVLCLLVAAVTFLVVTWSWLGVGGRTTVLVLLTAASGVLSGWLNRRHLRLAGEALSVVAFGLLVLDLVGADDAGWLGVLSGADLLAFAGAVVGGVGLLVALGLRDSAAPMISPQVFGAAGVWAVPVGIGVESDHLGLVAALATGVLLALAAGARALELRLLVVLLGLAAASWWVTLLAIGTARALDHRSVTGLVAQGHAWPLLVASSFLVALAWLVRDRPAYAGLLLGGAGALVSALVLVPATDDGGTAVATLLLVLLALWAVAAPLTRPPWTLVTEVPVTGLGLLALGLVAESAVVALTIVGAGADAAWTRDWTTDVPLSSAGGSPAVPAAMLLPLVAALLLAALTWRRTPGRAVGLVRDLAVPLLAVLALTGAGAAVLEVLPSALVLAVLAVAAAGLGVWAVRGDARVTLPGLTGAALLAAGAVLVALPSAVLTAVALTPVAAAAAALLWLDDRRMTSPAGSRVVTWAAGAVLPAAMAGLVWSLAEIGDVPDVWRATPALLVVGLLAVARPLPALEGSAALAGAVAAAVSVDAAVDVSTALALHLTLAGALVTGSSLVHGDRRQLGWAGGLLLAAATWVRLWDLGVEAPEAYTLPSAVALVLVGLWHLVRHPDAPTARALTPGLVLATVPSLLRVVVEDPISWRAGLLGLGCLVLVLGGAALRWQAPLVVGTAVGAVLVLREWGPYAGVVPPWVWIAAAGTTLLVVGITWERRLNELRGGVVYLARLR
ncbi:MAG: hypothetical protein ABIQ15_00180 [Nocardioides sp.]